ncbi:hypothetical protein BsWGS_06102 [Bradybaena similaris]
MKTIIFVLCAALCLLVSGQKPDYCSLSPEVGPCKALVPRIYYNPETAQCEKFIWGGCDGNDNNFETLEDCLDFCVRSE